MLNTTPRTKVRRPKRYSGKNQSSNRIDTVVPTPKVEEDPVATIGRPNVFAFMEAEQAEETVLDTDQPEGKDEEEVIRKVAVDKRSQASEHCVSSPTRSESDASEDSQRTRVEEYILQSTSFHSDSGISMGSGSSEYDSPVLSYKVPHTGSPPTRSEDADAAQPTLTATFVNQEKDGTAEGQVDEEPEAYYASARQVSFETPHQRPANARRPSLPRSSRPEKRASRPQQVYTKRGYDLLASNISSNNATVLKPLYRRFEAFNNRVLLYLQDEIAEMEGELRDLDTAIAHESEAMGNKMASRRAEARVPSQLQWHRLELLGRSFAKIEQYSKLDTSFKAFTGSLTESDRLCVSFI